MGEKPRHFTKKEMREFDGKAGRPAYVAFKGKVYDISKSRLWVDGDHKSRHFAGGDLTPAMINAPHSEEVFKEFPVIGEQKRTDRQHFHSMLVHFSVALSFIIPVLAGVYLVANNISFERASYYLLIALLIVTPFAGASGFFSWKSTYEGRRSRMFDRKIMFTVLVTVIVIGCGVWRILAPGLLVEKTFFSYVYLILLITVAGITALLGHYGGKIVYP